MRKDPVLSYQLNSMKSTPSLSTSCDFLRHCPLMQSPPLQYSPSSSTPAMFIPVFSSSVNVHSCNFSQPLQVTSKIQSTDRIQYRIRLLKFYESPVKTTFLVISLAAKTGQNITLLTGGRSTVVVIIGLLTSGGRERCRSPWLQKTHPLSSRQSARPPCHLCTAANNSPPSRHRTK